MAVVHGIVLGHNGYVDVNSRPGHGSKFSVYLPILEKITLTTLPERAEEILIGGKEKIMLVDDEESILISTKALLEDFGYEVSSFCNGMDAFGAFKSTPHQFDIVITDVSMPKMNGVMLVKKILAVKPEQPIIICTGYSDLIDRKKAVAMGIYYHEKPLAVKEIVKSIRKILDGHKIS